MADMTPKGALPAYLCAAEEEVITRQLEGQEALGQAQEQVLEQLLLLATRLAASAAE